MALPAAHRHVQVTPDRGQRHVDDGGIDKVEETNGAEQHQDELAATSREYGLLTGWRRHR
jgi:hypothetical protein